jgi:hypothetical protein
MHTVPNTFINYGPKTVYFKNGYSHKYVVTLYVMPFHMMRKLHGCVKYVFQWLHLWSLLLHYHKILPHHVLRIISK